MPQPGTILGDTFEQLKDAGKKIVKEVVTSPVDIVLESFEQPIPNPTKERAQQLEAERKAKLAKVRSGLSVLQETPSKPQEDRRIEQGATITEKGQTNKNAQMNNQQLSANMTPKKKPEPLVVQQKRNNKLHGAG